NYTPKPSQQHRRRNGPADDRPNSPTATAPSGAPMLGQRSRSDSAKYSEQLHAQAGTPGPPATGRIRHARPAWPGQNYTRPNPAEGTGCAPRRRTESATARSDVTTTTGRPSGSAATNARITSSASTPGSLNSTRTPRGAADGTATTPAPSNTSVTSADVRAASAASWRTSRSRWSDRDSSA